MNNFEYIQQVSSLKELAEFLREKFDEHEECFGCGSCINYGTHHHNPQECRDCEFYMCGTDIEKWLNLEHVSEV